jgi:tripartite-type tricarboxylate transporter receptor subunit TctC
MLKTRNAQNTTLLLMASLVAGAALVSPAEAQFYKGKTLTLVVNYGAGGNADSGARMFQRHIARHIPGNPTVVVQNMPGAGGYTAMNNVGLNINRKPDGLTAGYFGLSPPGLIARDPGLRVTMRDFAMVGAARDWGVAYVRKDTAPGINQPADLAKAKQIFAGGYGRANSNDTRSSLALQVFNVPYRMIIGFQGTADLNKAMMQNEINYITSALPAFQRLAMPQLIKTGIAIPVFYYPVAKADGQPGEIAAFERMGIPSFHKVYQQAFGKPPSGAKFEALLLLCDLGSNTHGVIALPKDAPAEAIADLRTGFNALRSDQAFIAEYEKLAGETPSLVTAEELAPVMQRLDTVRPEVVQIVKDTIGMSGG